MANKEIKVYDNLPYPVTVANAVYLSGTSKTVEDYLKQLNWIYGKKILCIGDSLTAGQGSTYAWCRIISDRNNMTLYQKGVSGQKIAGIANRCASLTESADIAIFW